MGKYGAEKNYITTVLQLEDKKVPHDPTREEILELLSYFPEQIAYLNNIGIEYKKEIDKMKQHIKAKRQMIEINQSKWRRDYLKRYKERLEKFFDEEYNLMFQKYIDLGMSKGEAKEMCKQRRPEKPTKGDLDDHAIIKTEVEEREIHALEEILLEHVEFYNKLKNKIDLNANNYKTVISAKGIIQSDITARMYNGS